ncbi:L,D-transpeptidase [Aestuariivirga litoralis]|uniref:L,D-transpeptidase n=1 Tax=Aestuariivirga litoralis TaxID=2650924 RepID=A0A2W2AX11_9HYPH|nr:L,D-transpeptidase [Aestuariivirga litoralis]PZF78282.1 L,D-transpeptidase [Aestuariivirga litoralis]
MYVDSLISRRRLLRSLATATTVPLWAGAAAAQLVNKLAYDLKNGEFNWFPERSEGGPILIIVSIPDQLVHVYRNGIRIAASTCSTGKPGHRTPTGVFQILQKDKHHHSSTYSNAPMPNMNRLTWSGIALHAGNLPGYPASHGCVRLPMQFSELLFDITRKGMTVVIADNTSQPAAITHPGMVLGDYARREFAAVDTALVKDQYTAGHEAKPSITSVVVSSKDKSVTVLEDGRVVAKGKATITGGAKPIGESVYSLTGSSTSDDSLTWSGMGYGKTDREDMGHELRRISADPQVREQIRKRMKNGMTVVTTDQSNSASHRATDFTIMEGVY